MKNRMLSLSAVALFLLTIPLTALAADLSTDIFDWGRMSKGQKISALNDIQRELKKNGCMGNPVDANQLLLGVEAALKRDNEQAIIADKVCEALRLNCEKIGFDNYK